MVRCEEFYKYFEKKGNFCNKSDGVVKKVEVYIDYVKRHKVGGYKISNCALDPFISTEFEKDGKVHDLALRELKKLLKNEKILPERVTRRISIELINKANTKVGDGYKLDRIPGIRQKMSEYEHTVEGIGYEVRTIFDALKKDVGAKNNNEIMTIMLELCVRDVAGIRKIKEEMENKNTSKENVVIVKTT